MVQIYSLTLILITAISSACFAQEELKEKLAKQYEDVSLLYNEVAIVKKNKKWGLINKKGTPLTTFTYDQINRKSLKHHDYNVYLVERDNKSGILSEAGEVIVPVDYFFVYPKEVGKRLFFEIYSDEKGGRALYDQENNHYYGKVGFLNSDGSILSPIQYESHYFDDFEKFNNSYEAYRIQVGKDDKEGFINLKGEEVIPIQFDDSFVMEGLGLIRLSLGDKEALVSVNGDTLVPLQFSKIIAPDVINEQLISIVAIKSDTAQSEGLYILGKGLVKAVCNCTYQKEYQVDHFIERSNEQYNLLTTSGRYLNKYPLDEINDYEDNYYIFTIDEKKGILNKEDGQVLVEPLYNDIWKDKDHLKLILDDGAIYYHIKKGCRHSFKAQDLNYAGHHIFYYTQNDSSYIYFANSDTKKPVNYKIIRDFEDNRAAVNYVDNRGVRMNDKVAFIDTTGTIVIEPGNFKPSFFSSGRVIQKKDDKFRYLDTMGNPINNDWYEEAEPFRGNIGIAKKNGFYGVIAADGEVIIPFAYSEIFSLEEYNGDEPVNEGEYRIRNKDQGYELWFKIFDENITATIYSYSDNEEYEIDEKEFSRILGVKKSDLDELY